MRCSTASPGRACPSDNSSPYRTATCTGITGNASSSPLAGAAHWTSDAASAWLVDDFFYLFWSSFLSAPPSERGAFKYSTPKPICGISMVKRENHRSKNGGDFHSVSFSFRHSLKLCLPCATPPLVARSVVKNTPQPLLTSLTNRKEKRFSCLFTVWIVTLKAK